MKKVNKRASEPEQLTRFRENTPNATWDDAHNDNSFDSQTIPQICCASAGEDQRGVCAYCEIKLEGNHPRVEHFHPKSDTVANCTFVWENMLAVCDGNSNSEEKTRPRYARLHCDAYKNHQVTSKNLPEDCDGWLLNPLTMPSDINLFSFDKRSGALQANEATCATCTIDGNKYTTTQEMVGKTIEHLNLNAPRLQELRRTAMFGFDKRKALVRKRVSNTTDLHAQLATMFLEPSREFFTTYRCLLGQSAETYLQQQNAQG